MRKLFWSLVCLAVLCVILTLGLWPFHSPENQVAWLRNRNGLRFGKYASVYTRGTFPEAGADGDASASIEVWFQPARARDSATLLTFYTPGRRHRFSLRQSLSDLELQTGAAGDLDPVAVPHFFVGDAFRVSEPTFLTISSGPRGTSVYADGALVRTDPQFRLSATSLAGRLIVGDSPGQPDNWSGRLFGLAIYRRELTAAGALRHFQTWTQRGLPEIFDTEHNVALYLFAERAGDVVRDRAGAAPDLYIPERYAIVDKLFLEPFWSEFSMSRSYWSSVLKNVVGFVPFGFCFFACLSAFRIGRAAFVTVVLGLLVSLTIEILQAYLPTRDSGMTDIFTNTFGTYIGALACRAASPILTAIFRDNAC